MPEFEKKLLYLSKLFFNADLPTTALHIYLAAIHLSATLHHGFGQCDRSILHQRTQQDHHPVEDIEHLFGIQMGTEQGVCNDLCKLWRRGNKLKAK
jgi:hypothetical protein